MELTVVDLESITRVVTYFCDRSDSIKRVGIVGSYARGTQDKFSDIDLVYDAYDYDRVYKEVIEPIVFVLDDQFIKRADSIYYRDILAHKEHKGPERWAEGYRQMLSDLIWIWGDKNGKER